MQPRPITVRRNTLTKPHPVAPNGVLYPTQATLPGASSTYITGVPMAPSIPIASAAGNMVAQQANAAQRPYLAAEMEMMQEALKISALKTAETIRYMTTVRRVGTASRVKGPPPAVANELRTQLARYDQLCDIVEARLVRAHAALSARLARERATNAPFASSNQNQPIVIDSPMSDDVPLSLSTTAPPTTLNSKYTPAPKARVLASLAAPRPSNSAPDSVHSISPVTLASNAAIPSALDAMPSHHAVVPGLLEALSRQKLEQARSAVLHRPPGQEMDMFGGTDAQTMDELFNPTGVGLDIDQTVAGIDTSVGGLDPSVANAVSAMHSAVPVDDMESAVAELDSAVAAAAAAAAAAGELGHPDDPLFADLHAASSGDGGATLTSDSFAGAGGFPPADDPFASGNMPASGEFPVSGTTGDGDKTDLLAELSRGGSTADGIDLEMNMDLIGIGGLGIAADEMGHTDKGEMENINLGDVGISDGNLMDDVGMDMGGDDIEAMWSSMPFDGIFAGIGDDMPIKTEED